MRKIMTSIPATHSTKNMLKELARQDKRSMNQYLEILVEETHKKNLFINSGNNILPLQTTN